MPSREELLGYLLGALDAHEQELVEYHLQQFPELEAELHELKTCMEPLSALVEDDEFSAPGFSAPGLARRTIEHVARVVRDPSYRVEFTADRPAAQVANARIASPPLASPPLASPPLALRQPAGPPDRAVASQRQLRATHPTPRRVVLMAVSALTVSLSLAPRTGNSWGEFPSASPVVRPPRVASSECGQPASPPPLNMWGRTCRITWIPEDATPGDAIPGDAIPDNSSLYTWADRRMESHTLWPPIAFPRGLTRVTQRSTGSSWGLAAAEADLLTHASSRE